MTERSSPPGYATSSTWRARRAWSCGWASIRPSSGSHWRAWRCWDPAEAGSRYRSRRGGACARGRAHDRLDPGRVQARVDAQRQLAPTYHEACVRPDFCASGDADLQRDADPQEALELPKPNPGHAPRWRESTGGRDRTAATPAADRDPSFAGRLYRQPAELDPIGEDSADDPYDRERQQEAGRWDTHVDRLAGDARKPFPVGDAQFDGVVGGRRERRADGRRPRLE